LDFWKEGNSITCDNVTGPWKCTKWDKPGTERQVLHESTNIRCPKWSKTRHNMWNGGFQGLGGVEIIR
jgi:hypothetical protein